MGGASRHTRRMGIHIAGRSDLPQLARLLWLHSTPVEQSQQSIESFAVDLGAWWKGHEHSHLAFISRRVESEPVGMAWLALLPRVPRPGATTRLSADIQSVFVVPEERGLGIGSALVHAAFEHAAHLGASRVTVHSGRGALALYERLGFGSSPHLLQKAVE